MARGRRQDGGSYQLEFATEATADVLGLLPPGPRRPRPGDVASVRIGHHFLSTAPKVIDDFSASGLLSALRLLQRIRNLDGPDDIASAVPTAFSEANQPYVEIGLLALLFPLVAISAVGAVRNALRVYSVEHPAAVSRKLDQQQAMLDALRSDGLTLGGQRVAAETDNELELLTALQRESVDHFEAQQLSRKRGPLHLVRHNLGNRWHRVRGNGELSQAFNEEVLEIIARRMAQARILSSVHGSYQLERLEKLERQRAAAKMNRTAALFTGVGMPTMAAGMPVSASGAVATAARSAAAETALSQTTAFVMGAAQGMQLTSGAIQLHLHRGERRQIGRDMDAVRQLDENRDGLPSPVLQQYLDEGRYRQRAASREMALSGMLTGGQALMLASSATGLFAAPVAAGLAVPGAVMTVAASVCSSLQADLFGRHAGDDAIEPIRDMESVGNLGPRLQDQGLPATTEAIGEGLLMQQRQVEQVRMWNDILGALAEEKTVPGQPPCSAEERRDRVTRNNRAVRGRSHLGPAGARALEALRQERYPLHFFQCSLPEIHEVLAREMAAHPHRRIVGRQAGFRQQVLFETLKVLSALPETRAGSVFHTAAGRRVDRITADTEFFAWLAATPVADAVFRQKHNEVLARHLVAGNRFARARHHEALTDLAHTRQRRQAQADALQLDPYEQTTRM